jgi:hypothetical protein
MLIAIDKQNKADCSYTRNVYTVKAYGYTIPKLSKIVEEVLHIKSFRTEVSLLNILANSGFSFITKRVYKIVEAKSPLSIGFILFIPNGKSRLVILIPLLGYSVLFLGFLIALSKCPFSVTWGFISFP